MTISRVLSPSKEVPRLDPSGRTRSEAMRLTRSSRRSPITTGNGEHFFSLQKAWERRSFPGNTMLTSARAILSTTSPTRAVILLPVPPPPPPPLMSSISVGVLPRKIFISEGSVGKSPPINSNTSPSRRPCAPWGNTMSTLLRKLNAGTPHGTNGPAGNPGRGYGPGGSAEPRKMCARE